jgi:hypothetical protein
MKQRVITSLIVAALILCCMALPAGAAILEVTVKGTVATVNEPKNAITIENPLRYGCTYPGSGAPVCSYTPMDTSALTGTVPDAAAFSVFKPGDPLVATSIGGAGETWITLAKLYGSRPNEEYATDLVGDITTIPTLLVGDYALDVATVPDCTQCTGTTCTAASSGVKIKSGGTVVFEKILAPGQSFTYNGRNDGSSVAVTFIKGEALSQSCAGMAMMTGPQAISVYVVKVVPPIGYAQKDIRTATTTRPNEALTLLPVTTAGAATMATVPAQAPTTKSGSLPVAVIGALGVMALVLAARKR